MSNKKLEVEVTRWTSVGSYDRAYKTVDGYLSSRVWASTLAMSICHATSRRTPAQYIARTQAWRPLDIHTDWRTWEGATKGNK